MRKPASNVRKVRLASGNHLGKNEFAVARYRQGDPLGSCRVTPLRDQVEPARGEPLAEEPTRDVDHRHDAAAADYDAFHFFCLMRKTKNAAGSDEFSDVACSQSKTTLREAKQHERLGL